MSPERLFVMSDEPIEVVREGLTRRRLAQTPTLSLVQWFREPGAEGTAHSHDTGQVNFVVSGRYRVRIGPHERELGPGDSFAVLAGTAHSIDCLEAGTYVAVKGGSASGATPASGDHGAAGHPHHEAQGHAHGGGDSHSQS